MLNSERYLKHEVYIFKNALLDIQSSYLYLLFGPIKITYIHVYLYQSISNITCHSISFLLPQLNAALQILFNAEKLLLDSSVVIDSSANPIPYNTIFETVCLFYNIINYYSHFLMIAHMHYNYIIIILYE